MARNLDTSTLTAAAQHYAALYIRNAGLYDRDFVLKQLFNMTFADEFDFITAEMPNHLGSAALDDFSEDVGALREKSPRSDSVFDQMLAEKLAIDRDGGHIPGLIGTTQVDSRLIGLREIEVETPESIARGAFRRRMNFAQHIRETHKILAPYYWPIYAGETEERLADSGVADDLPEGTPGMPVGANVPRISNALARAMADQITVAMDGGTGAGVIQCRSGAQPAGVDVAATGVLLASLVATDPFAPAAADGAPGGLLTASAIADDTSADATGTVGYCRASSTNDSITPLLDVFDGEAGTSGADYNFTTVAFVAGAVISMSSLTLTVPEG